MQRLCLKKNKKKTEIKTSKRLLNSKTDNVNQTEQGIGYLLHDSATQ
jgi:hypothetical protein